MAEIVGTEQHDCLETSGAEPEPSCVTLYQHVVAAPAAPLHDVAEFRGPERVLTPLPDPGTTEPRVYLSYPAEAPAPIENANSSALRDDDATRAWQRRMTLLVGAMQAPADDDQGIAGLFERAGRAMLRALTPGPGAEPPDDAPTPAADAEGNSCPGRRAVARWHRHPNTGRQRPAPAPDCGCTADEPCLSAWCAAHPPSIQPGLTWDELERSATQSALIRAARSRGIAARALDATKTRPPQHEGGLWGHAVAVWDFQGPLASRVHGVPVVTMAPCWRLVVDGDPIGASRTAIFAYQEDVHITKASLAGPGGELHAAAERQEMLRWAGDPRLRESAVALALEGVWMAFSETAQQRPGGHHEVPRYDVMSNAERQMFLTVDSTVPHLALQHDADEKSLDDTALAQVFNGYSDLGSDLRHRVISNGLLVGAGLEAIPGRPGAQAVYRAISRSLLAAARSRPNTPAAQAAAWTSVWQAANGRHRIPQRAAGLPRDWVARRWPALQANRDDWAAVEQELCDRAYDRLGRDGLLSTGDHDRCDRCGRLPSWGAVVHAALPAPAGAACAITQYITGARVHDDDPGCPGADRTPASEFAGAIALLVHRFLHSSTLYDLGWLLAGAIWFHEALHLRACIVDLVGGESSHLSPDDW
ncbi:hypothetical protein [Streptomyces sp. NPDC046821]|uniref:hypothetical protein n=1 Tax=Streptomyces sp. NPDC046821 TaxID=3154702 RepID=UPI00340AECC9